MDRADLIARWLDLTRRQLPAMARQHGWPISQDHCFMRVCLDAACGRPWHQVIERPAMRHAPDEILARAVRIAEQTLADPDRLRTLNNASLKLRGKR